MPVAVAGAAQDLSGVTAVDGIDLQVRPGEIFGLVGPDGAGKTTTMRLLTGLLDPDAGALRVAGFDVLRQTESDETPYRLHAAALQPLRRPDRGGEPALFRQHLPCSAGGAPGASAAVAGIQPAGSRLSSGRRSFSPAA